MKQSLQLRIGQSLSMTPQLQQAIKLLQLSSLELHSEIQEILDSNPLLEAEDNSEIDNNDTSKEEKKSDEPGLENSNEIKTSADSVADNRADQKLPDELATDSDWGDFYDHTPTATASATSAPPSADEQRDIYDNKTATSNDLIDHLIWQLNAARLSTSDYNIGISIIDGIDDQGYLREDIEDIRLGLANGIDIEPDEVEAVMHLIQNFDPIGVASRSPAECMSVQLKRMPPDTPHLKKALILVDRYLEPLARNDIAVLKRRLHASEAELSRIIELIRSTHPHPGQVLSSQPIEYIIPDVYVKKYKNEWCVSINPDHAPKLSLNNLYASMIKRGDRGADNTFLKNNLQEAKWFIKSLKNRHDTLLNVANAIVSKQTDFFNYGEEAMKPMVLKDIADPLEMHESTISRITSNKYMHTPKGILEFKFFFSSHVGTADGGACSATAIRSIIKKLIAAEVPKKPLSDNKIAALLDEQGINVARRTVAKYREALNIPPSNERKRLL